MNSGRTWAGFINSSDNTGTSGRPRAAKLKMTNRYLANQGTRRRSSGSPRMPADKLSHRPREKLMAAITVVMSVTKPSKSASLP